LNRIRYLFDEFENITVSFSGGKDSTVVLNLALIVAREKGRLPLKVVFIDQEAEWQTVIDYIRRTMSRPEVEPLWFQMPIKIFNATSSQSEWLYCWEDGKEAEWIREKEPNSIKVNRYGTDRFAELFPAITDVEFGGQKACAIAGVRAEESYNRRQGLTSFATYKHVTWGNKWGKEGIFTFYPIYDWSYKDVWAAIHRNGWEYCQIYDYMWQYGVPVSQMRVSNVHHETAVKTLYYLQEIEAGTWEKITARINGINTAGHLKGNAFDVPKQLPYMFADWREYRDHLLKNLIAGGEAQERFRKKFEQMDRVYHDLPIKDEMYKVQISAILTNDYHLTKLGN